jgi:putative Mg2+ transporter-C (MgtC) family protein
MVFAEIFMLERDLTFFIGLLFSLVAGYLIGLERESRGKDAGISTHTFVIAGAMLFTYISMLMEPNNTLRIAANVLTGVGFLGAGIIMKSEGGHITNLTTAASLWFAAAIGMSIALGWYLIALSATVFSVVIPRLPHKRPVDEQEKKPAPAQNHYHRNWKQ